MPTLAGDLSSFTTLGMEKPSLLGAASVSIARCAMSRCLSAFSAANFNIPSEGRIEQLIHEAFPLLLASAIGRRKAATETSYG